MHVERDRHTARMITTLRDIGDGWSLLIVWAALQGVTRFDAFQNRLGVARNILSNRLTRLVDEDILRKVPVREGARRLEYRLTDKGEALSSALDELGRWGEAWMPQRQEAG